MTGDWVFNDEDREAAASLGAKLPDEIFDIHAHIYRQDFLPPGPGLFQAAGRDVTPAVWRERVGNIFGRERLSGALFLAHPVVTAEIIGRVNEWTLAAAEGEKCRALLVVAPGQAPREFEAFMDRPGFAGFKPYHVHSPVKPTFDAAPGDYIPEWAWEAADERGLIITLHLVRAGAMADPVNTRYIAGHCEKYPGAKLVLAHAGRSFHGPNARAGAGALAGLGNIWFDTSAVCEAEPFEALLEAFGPRRLIWGTDFPVSEQRGRCVTIGDGFLWVTEEAVRDTGKGPAYRMWPVGLESLRAFFLAADNSDLSRGDLEDIFSGNARRLLGAGNGAVEAVEGEELYRHAKKRIPGGTQLLSKRPEMFAPGKWPAYYREARGCRVTDLDGRDYLDFSVHGIGACLLGFRDPDVTRAVSRRLSLGSFCTLNPPEEVALADRLCEIHPWAGQARFTRSGGEAMAVAARIARASTDRSAVAVCGYHGWHDWYLAANLGGDDSLRGHLLPGLEPLGVPRELRGTCDTFTFNSREEFDRVMDSRGRTLAAVVMEPCRGGEPEPGFLEHVRQRTREAGTLLVFDEITIGWRLCLGGAHLLYGVEPDLAVFAKALGNGHPVAAVIGTSAAMEGAHGSFISSTYWTDGIGPAAALATLEKMARVDVPGHCREAGLAVRAAWAESARRHCLPLEVAPGFPALSRFDFRHERAVELKTLFTRLMLERGFLAGAAFYASLAHTGELVEKYAAAVDEVFGLMARALDRCGDGPLFSGPPARAGFHRLA